MKSKQQTAKLFRQGDVLLERVASAPKALKKIPREGGRIVLAHGKSTGHSHAIPTARCDLFEDPKTPGVRYLKINAAKAELVHDEHNTVSLPKGTYRVERQREFSAAEIRRVED